MNLQSVSFPFPILLFLFSVHISVLVICHEPKLCRNIFSLSTMLLHGVDLYGCCGLLGWILEGVALL